MEWEEFVMSKAYSLDLRHRIIEAVSGGLSCRAAALRFSVSASTAIRYQQRLRRTGCLEPDRRGRLPGRGKLAPYREMLIAKVEEQADITMPELTLWLFERTGVQVHPSNLSRLLCKAGYTYKKTTDGLRTKP